MRFHHRWIVAALTVCFIVFLMLLIDKQPAIDPATQVHSVNLNSSDSNMACRWPDLDLNDPVFKTFFTPSFPIECDSEKDWVCIDQGKAYVCDETLKRYRDVDCSYTFLDRRTDYWTADGQVVKANSNSTTKPIELKADFFKVSCVSNNGTTWSNIMAGIMKDQAIHSRAGWDKVPKTGLKLNVLIWGFDSVSRNTFMRKLPKTYSFLRDKLGAIVLKGYNIVGDGTPQALIPILTGKTELELPEVRKRMDYAHPVDVYPLVWKEFQTFGYVTAFTEDAPSIGTFTYRLTGFREQPTDHYMRTFYVAADKEFKQHKALCLRGTPRHKVLMNWVGHFFEMYASKPKFLFTFHNELSHNDYNLVGSTDDDLKEMLEKLEGGGHLNDTLLIVMSDHGHRFAKIREYQQGKQEERLPFFSFTFPHWFSKKYPQAASNFKINTERLTTPFDVFSTLRDVLHLEDVGVGSTDNRSISLFTEVPENRTCESAGIEPHWCTCLRWNPIYTNDTQVLTAANYVLSFINNLTESHRRLCDVLVLGAIVWAGQYKPLESLLRYQKNADKDGFVADFSAKTKANIVLYQVKIHTTPGDGHFEASLTYDVLSKRFKLKESDISRTNKYGSAAHCVVSNQEQLRKFCHCTT